MDNHSNAGPRVVYMGQIMAECDCNTPVTCKYLARCFVYEQKQKSLELDAMLERIAQPPSRQDRILSVIIALIIVALLLLGLSLDVQATVDAVNGGLDL